MTKDLYTWGETVRIAIDAPKAYKPGVLAEVCSMWKIETEENSKSRGEPIGTVIYSIEFGDGTLIRNTTPTGQKSSLRGEKPLWNTCRLMFYFAISMDSSAHFPIMTRKF